MSSTWFSCFLAMLIAQMIQRSIINLSSEMCIRKCRAESGWVIVWYSGGVDARLSPHMVLHPWLCIIEEKTWTKSTKSASFVWWDMLPLFLNFFKSSFFQASCHQHFNTDGMWVPRLKSVVIGDLSITNRNVSQPLRPTPHSHNHLWLYAWYTHAFWKLLLEEVKETYSLNIIQFLSSFSQLWIEASAWKGLTADLRDRGRDGEVR